MDVHVAQELLKELGSSLENLETQQAALLQLLKDKAIVTDEQLGPYLDQAGNASSVRWRAAHVRLGHIFSAATQKEQQTAISEEQRAPETRTPQREKMSESGRKSGRRSKKQATKEKPLAQEQETQTAEAKSESPGDGPKTNGTERTSTQSDEKNCSVAPYRFYGEPAELLAVS